MKIPKKITPDGLVEAIVQIVFDSGCSKELVLGKFHSLFEKDLLFIQAPDKISTGGPIIINETQTSFFTDKQSTIKINVNANSLTFNYLESYPGWDMYFGFITNIIEKLESSSIISKVNRIGIRYINNFKELELMENLLLELKNPLNKKNTQTQIRSNFNLNNFQITLNLADLMPPKNPGGHRVSTIDVDVIKIMSNQFTSAPVLKSIEEAHTTQKEVFFSLLRPSYLESLNPEY